MCWDELGLGPVPVLVQHIEWHNVRNAASDPWDFSPELYPTVYKELAKFPETKKVTLPPEVVYDDCHGKTLTNGETCCPSIQ